MIGEKTAIDSGAFHGLKRMGRYSAPDSHAITSESRRTKRPRRTGTAIITACSLRGTVPPATTRALWGRRPLSLAVLLLTLPGQSGDSRMFRVSSYVVPVIASSFVACFGGTADDAGLSPQQTMEIMSNYAPEFSGGPGECQAGYDMFEFELSDLNPETVEYNIENGRIQVRTTDNAQKIRLKEEFAEVRKALHERKEPVPQSDLEKSVAVLDLAEAMGARDWRVHLDFAVVPAPDLVASDVNRRQREEKGQKFAKALKSIITSCGGKEDHF